MPVARYRVVITQTAWDDLDAICQYIASDSPANALHFASRIEEAMLKLNAFPLRGALAPEGEIEGLSVRHRPVGNYRILYAITGRTTYVVGIRHSKRLPRST